MEEPQSTPKPDEPTPTPTPETPPENQPPETPDKPKPEKSKKKLSKKTLLIALVVVLALAGGAYAYYSKNKKVAAPASSNTQTSAQTEPETVTADSVLYYSQPKFSEPFTIYKRPATGGERKAIMTLSGKVEGVYYTVSKYDVRGQNAAFATNDGIYVSQDGGNTFKNVFPTDAAHTNNDKTITSVRFSTDNKKLVFAIINATEDKAKDVVNMDNVVKIMDLDGKNVSDLHTFDERVGIFIYSYNPSTQDLVYATGCYFCDGGPSTPRLMNIKTGSDKTLLTVDDKTNIYNGASANNAGTKLVYYLGNHNQSAEEAIGGVGFQGVPPYKIMELDVASAKSTEIATVGTANEKASDGNFKTYWIQTGFTADKSAPYYTADNKLFVLSGSKSSLLFEATRNIMLVPYASADVELTNIENAKHDNGDYTLFRYETSGQKTTSIFEGDFNTYTMGVTTK